MSVLRRLAPALFLLATACGADGAAVGGSLHPSLLAAEEGGEGWTVWAEEAEREAPVRDGRFALDGLAPGPVHLQLRRQGEPVGRIVIPGLGAGTEVRLRELRVDDRSGLAFPRAVEVDGGRVVWINGIRMAPADAVPDSVDTRGAVLALAPDAGVMLFRPDDGTLPDLRLVAAPRTSPLTLDDLAVGDSLRVAGRRTGDHVLVSLLEPVAAPDDGDAGDVGSSADFSGSSGDVTGSSGEAAPDPPSSAGVAAAAPVVRGVPPGRSGDPPGKGRGRGRGKGKGGKDDR